MTGVYVITATKMLLEKECILWGGIVDKDTVKAIDGIINTLNNLVESLKTQAEFNKKVMEKLESIENYEYLEQ